MKRAIATFGVGKCQAMLEVTEVMAVWAQDALKWMEE